MNLFGGIEDMFSRGRRRGEAVGWCRGLPVGSIHTFETLEKAFKVAFEHKVRWKKLKMTLLVLDRDPRLEGG